MEPIDQLDTGTEAVEHPPVGTEEIDELRMLCVLNMGSLSFSQQELAWIFQAVCVVALQIACENRSTLRVCRSAGPAMACNRGSIFLSYLRAQGRFDRRRILAATKRSGGYYPPLHAEDQNVTSTWIRRK